MDDTAGHTRVTQNHTHPRTAFSKHVKTWSEEQTQAGDTGPFAGVGVGRKVPNEPGGGGKRGTRWYARPRPRVV